MIDLSKLREMRQMYDEGANLIEYLKNQGYDKDTLSEAIMISYDIQSGSYTRSDEQKPEVRENYTDALAKVLNQLDGFSSIMEAGVGEATTLSRLLPKLQQQNYTAYGFDISWSRIKYAQANCIKRLLQQVKLFTGDLFSIPIQSSAVDIVYTLHSLESNGGREKEALQELYRVASSYLVLLEPMYEWASEEGKARMDKFGYIKNLYDIIKELNYNVVEYRLLEYSVNPLNPTGLIIIKKEKSTEQDLESPLACPITKYSLSKEKDCYYSKEGLLAYPIIDSIPCLLPQNAVVATHFMDS